MLSQWNWDAAVPLHWGFWRVYASEHLYIWTLLHKWCTPWNNSVEECCFYLASFLPSGKKHFPQEFEKIEKMFFSLFVSQEDHEAIQAAMVNVPTMGLFMYKYTNIDSQHSRQSKKQKDKPMVTHDAECLAAVNYFWTSQDTIVLWLGTMLNEPPIESVHVIWHMCGFVTYLLCLLI